MNIVLTNKNMSDIKKDLMPLLDRTPYSVISTVLNGGDTAKYRIEPTVEMQQWHVTNRHEHYCREVLFVLSGSTFTFSGNDFFYCPSGTLQLFPAHEKHNCSYLPGSSGIHIWGKVQNTRMVFFGYELHPQRSEMDCTAKFSYIFSDKDILRRLNSAWDELPAGKAETVVELEALFRLIFCTVYRNTGTEPNLRQEMMVNIRKLLTDTCGRDMDIDHLARLAGYSKQHFMRKFKEINGCTVGEIIETARLKELEEIPPGMQIKELADKLGFDSASAFCHWRKKHISDNGKK